jgi:hypothetical protein
MVGVPCHDNPDLLPTPCFGLITFLFCQSKKTHMAEQEREKKQSEYASIVLPSLVLHARRDSFFVA